jgi:hypothetical protein
MTIRKRAGLVGISIFGLPFAAASVASFYSIPASLRDNNAGDALVASLVGAIVGWFGFGILGAVVIQWNWIAALDRLRDAHPGKQWLWRADWAAGRADDLTQRKMRTMWFFALLWTVLFVPFSYFALKNVATTAQYPLLILLIFPAASLGWIYGAIRYSARWRKFGQSSFVMAGVPFSIGGQVAGAIQFQKPFPPGATFHLELTCTRQIKTKDSAGKSFTDEDDIWSDKTTAQLDARGMVPVKFQLPGNVPETDMRDSDNQITWQLEVKAPVKGTAYKASFDVPVGAAPT